MCHFIDSAANNHQRFVRLQFEINPVIYYDQDNWVRSQQYQSSDTEQLINLWEGYNRHLAHVIKHIPKENLSRTAIGKDGSKYSLKFLIDDYVKHLQYHLNQLLS